MADEESDSTQEQQAQRAKKKRLQGACDTCRKRKIKCDSALKLGNVCSHCEGSNIPCTHDAPRPPKKKEAQEAHIHSLEDRLSRMQRAFRFLHPDRDLETLLDSPDDILNLKLDSPTKNDSLNNFPDLKYPAPQLPATLLLDESSPDAVKQEPVDPAEEQQDLSHVDLVEHMNKLFIEDKRFFGQSSTYMFAQYAMNAKMEASGTHTEYPLDSKMLRRPLYWGMRPWEMAHARSEENIRFVYPQPDLLNSLVSLYFGNVNIILPILHRPTFLRSLNSQLHLREPAFGMTVLLVCAIGSRFSSDSQVLLDNDISDLSAGWKYFTQVPIFRRGLFTRSMLYDLQCYILSVVYLLGTSTAHVIWPLLGLGARFAQEKGVHRRKGQQKHTVEHESEKLAFWSLVCLDRWMSAFLGRPCTMQDEEFDVEYPAECDEEYWETSDPDEAFKQPPGKPCKMSSFIWLIKLAEMLGFATRTLYATKKSKILIGLIGNEWESRVVSELDSSMNKWKDSLPDYLRWNPENPDPTFFSQSVALYTCFYHLQIQVHRPFLMKRSALSRTSLAMCTNAARSTARVLEAAMSRGIYICAPSHMSGFAAALVLLLIQWAHQQTDSTFDTKTTMGLVRKLFLALKSGERKCQVAGRFVDLLQILCSLSDYPGSPQPKRRSEPTIISPSVSHNEQNYHGALWEQSSFTGGPLQRQIAASKLELPPHMQEYYVPTNNWDANNFLTPQVGSHVQQPFITTQVDNTLPGQPLTQDAHPASILAGTNFHPFTLGQAPYAPHLFDPHLQPQLPINPAEFDVSDDVFAVWENTPISFGSYDWDIFLSNARQPQSGPC